MGLANLTGLIDRRNHRIKEDATAVKTAERRGILFASGLITGEALMGILLAVPIVVTGNPKIMAVIDKPLGSWVGLVLLAGVAVWLTKVALPATTDS